MATLEEALAKRQQGYEPHRPAYPHRGEFVEMISYPSPEDSGLFIMARTTPGDASTMRRFRCEELVPFEDDTQVAVLAGSMDEGFGLYGPFNREDGRDLRYNVRAVIGNISPDDAERLLGDLRGLIGTVCKMHMIRPVGVVAQEVDDPHVILWGDPMIGYRAIGPFQDFEAAEQWSGNVAGSCWIAPLKTLAENGSHHENEDALRQLDDGQAESNAQ